MKTRANLALFLLIAMLFPSESFAKKKAFIYQPPQAEYEAWFNSNVVINRSSNVFQNVDGRRLSPNEEYWYTITYALVNQPTGKRLDYTTSIYKGTDYFINVTLFDVSMEGVPEVRWLNDKLLYFEWWWRGKIGAYMIFDTEKEHMVAREMMFTEEPKRMPSYQNFRELR